MINLLKKSGLESQLDQLFPANKRTEENIKVIFFKKNYNLNFFQKQIKNNICPFLLQNKFSSHDLNEIVTYRAGQVNAGAKKDVQVRLETVFYTLFWSWNDDNLYLKAMITVRLQTWCKIFMKNTSFLLPTLI